MRRILVLLPFFTIGCRSVPDALVVDSRFTDIELAEIGSAVEEWHRATGSDIADPRVETGFEFDVASMDEDDAFNGPEPFYVRRASVHDPVFTSIADLVGYSDMIAATYRHDGMILFREMYLLPNGEVDRAVLRGTVLHELGHMFDLDDGDGALMSAFLAAPCIDQETLDGFCDLYACSGQRATCP